MSQFLEDSNDELLLNMILPNTDISSLSLSSSTSIMEECYRELLLLDSSSNSDVDMCIDTPLRSNSVVEIFPDRQSISSSDFHNYFNNNNNDDMHKDRQSIGSNHIDSSEINSVVTVENPEEHCEFNMENSNMILPNTDILLSSSSSSSTSLMEECYRELLLLDSSSNSDVDMCVDTPLRSNSVVEIFPDRQSISSSYFHNYFNNNNNNDDMREDRQSIGNNHIDSSEINSVVTIENPEERCEFNMENFFDAEDNEVLLNMVLPNDDEEEDSESDNMLLNMVLPDGNTPPPSPLLFESDEEGEVVVVVAEQDRQSVDSDLLNDFRFINNPLPSLSSATSGFISGSNQSFEESLVCAYISKYDIFTIDDNDVQELFIQKCCFLCRDSYDFGEGRLHFEYDFHHIGHDEMNNINIVETILSSKCTICNENLYIFLKSERCVYCNNKNNNN